jgi:hypothetical protein
MSVESLARNQFSDSARYFHVRVRCTCSGTSLT